MATRVRPAIGRRRARRLGSPRVVRTGQLSTSTNGNSRNGAQALWLGRAWPGQCWTVREPAKESQWTCSSTRESSTSPASGSRCRRAGWPSPPRGRGAERTAGLPRGSKGPGPGGGPRQSGRDQAGRHGRGGPGPCGSHPGHGHQGVTSCAGSGWSMRPTSPRSTTPVSPWTGGPRPTWPWSRPGGASTSRRWRPKTRRPSPASTSTPTSVSARPRPALVDEAGLDEEAKEGASRVLVDLYRCFVEGDADLVEVNPFDPDTRWPGARPGRQGHPGRQRRLPPPRMGAIRRDRRARRARTPRPARPGLQYVGLDGFVGIIANGAGLAMSTCDVVNQVGGRPANFLDIGGGASAEVMANALEVINCGPERPFHFHKHLRRASPGAKKSPTGS